MNSTRPSRIALKLSVGIVIGAAGCASVDTEGRSGIRLPLRHRVQSLRGVPTADQPGLESKTRIGVATSHENLATFETTQSDSRRSLGVLQSPEKETFLGETTINGTGDDDGIELVNGTDSHVPAERQAESQSKTSFVEDSQVESSTQVSQLKEGDPSVMTRSEPQSKPAEYQLNLGNVLFLADAQNPLVAVARERINEAYARVERAESLWLPSLRAGMHYGHHEGAIQDVAGQAFETNRSSLYGGMGAGAVGGASPSIPGVVAQFHLSDAVFQPKIASHQASARQCGATAVRNDTLRDAAVAYLELVRAEHAQAIAQEALKNTESLVALTRDYAKTGQGLQSDFKRTEAELALKNDELVARRESVQLSSARLAQILHADPSVPIISGEPVIVALDVITPSDSAASYVATGLSRRPELAEQKHLVCEAVERLRREKYAPLVPSVLLGTSYGGFGGGFGSSIIDSNDRWDADAIAYWEIRNLGFGERAVRNEAASISRQAQLKETAVLDRIAREVTETHAQVLQRRERIEYAKKGVMAAEESYSLNLHRIENAQGLPIEVLQSIQALATARRAYLNAVIDYNIAQFEFCRAIGWFMDAPEK